MRADTSKTLICPFCKTAIAGDEAIVKCSQCGMPHHKDCWITNQGCTTFGCLGTIDSTDSTDSGTAARTDGGEYDFEITFEGDVVIGNRECPVCESLNSVDNYYCHRCGTKLK